MNKVIPPGKIMHPKKDARMAGDSIGSGADFALELVSGLVDSIRILVAACLLK
jgi:hypothetical protein